MVSTLWDLIPQYFQMNPSFKCKHQNHKSVEKMIKGNFNHLRVGKAILSMTPNPGDKND